MPTVKVGSHLHYANDKSCLPNTVDLNNKGPTEVDLKLIHAGAAYFQFFALHRVCLHKILYCAVE